MEPKSQKAVLAAMMLPGFYPHPVEGVTRCETHISSVFLTGAYVYKIKKPVDLGFLDFTTLEKRERFCRQEILLNRRLSSGVYLEVLPITAQQGRYSLNGSGETVEFAVRMRQLADSDAMLRRLRRSALAESEIDTLIDRLVGFYAAAPPVLHPREPERPAWEENLQIVEAFAGTAVDRGQFDFVRSATQAFARRHRRLFHQRIAEGRIRDGHGDLRSDHIYFTRDGIQIIDCIEFNDRLRVLDVISDLSFLAMDLEYNRFPRQARQLIRGYVERTGDVGALPLLDFYRCYRAMVRCKVSCFLLRDIGVSGPRRNALQAGADGYLTLAHAYAADFSRPRLWIVCGLPASGKSTIAESLAGMHDIRVIRSDVVRKGLFSGRSASPAETAFDEGLYSAYATEVTYKEMFGQAQEELKKGRSVILDATFSREVQRREVLRMAANRQALPVFVECRAADALLAERLRRRETEPSISDARLIHLEAFKKRFAPLAGLEGAVHLVVDTATPPVDCLRQIMLDDSVWSGLPTKGGNDV